MADQDALAETRRALLRQAMQERGLNPTDLARKAGMPSPNSIYNFMSGISKSLNTATYQAIVAQMPGLTLSDLLGEKTKKSGFAPVLVKTYCQGNHLRDQFSLPPNQMKELPLPVEDSARQAGAYAAIVKRPGAEEIYPAGTILLCVPVARFEGKIAKGRRLVIERLADTRLEVTVREVQEDPEGRLWLSQRSSDPRLQGAVKMPLEVGPKPWQSAGERYAVAGVVIGAFVPET